MGTLYVVATPIGNLEDITLRALRVLREASLIAAEDTRVTRRLLAHYDIHTPLVSYFQHNRLQRIPHVLEALARGDVALVSDAGTPGLNDPGEELVRAALAHGVPVVPVPGPSALTAVLSVAGLPVEQFVYLGFPPRARQERRALFQAVAAQPRALVLLEAPHRLRACLEDALAVLGDRRATVGRELTKVFEEIYRGPLSGALAHFTAPRGEFTVVIEGAPAQRGGPEGARDEAWARAELARLRRRGTPPREAVGLVSEASGLPRRTVYRLWVEGERT